MNLDFPTHFKIGHEEPIKANQSREEAYADPKLIRIAEMAQLLDETCREIFVHGTMSAIWRQGKGQKLVLQYRLANTTSHTSASLNYYPHMMELVSNGASLCLQWDKENEYLPSFPEEKYEIDAKDRYWLNREIGFYSQNYRCGNIIGTKDDGSNLVDPIHGINTVHHAECLGNPSIPMTSEEKENFKEMIKTVFEAPSHAIPDGEIENYDVISEKTYGTNPWPCKAIRLKKPVSA